MNKTNKIKNQEKILNEISKVYDIKNENNMRIKHFKKYFEVGDLEFINIDDDNMMTLKLNDPWSGLEYTIDKYGEFNINSFKELNEKNLLKVAVFNRELNDYDVVSFEKNIIKLQLNDYDVERIIINNDFKIDRYTKDGKVISTNKMNTINYYKMLRGE